MAELIDRKEIFFTYSKKDKEEYGGDFAGGVLFALDKIDEMPTIEAKPVVYGKWEVVSNGEDKWVNKCTACGAYLKRGYKQTNHCPNCGANMFKKEGE